MPTIIRFVITVAVLAALVGAAMFYLANFVEPNSREMTVRIPADKLNPVPIAKPAPSPVEPPPAQGDGTAAE
jgi:hypothetical protein